MEMVTAHQGIRPNPSGDLPEIDSTAFVDPSAQIIGNVRIGPDVYIGPNAVLRSDEADAEGKVHPLVLEAECSIQDGVIVHSMRGASVRIGPRVTIAHGCIIHGPCEIGADTFIGFRAVIFGSTLEEEVWVGVGAIILEATLLSHTMVPAGSLIHSHVNEPRLVRPEEKQLQEEVLARNRELKEGYWNLHREGKE
jgi:carbonic anhydrase/acetyltransferase-like protein (isoleucine patch superfamily)